MKKLFRTVIWNDENVIVDIFERQHSNLTSALRSVKKDLNNRRFGTFRITVFDHNGEHFNSGAVFDKVWTTKDAR